MKTLSKFRQRSTLTLLWLALAGCASLSGAPPDSAEIAILGINDFHGHIQSAQPIPRMVTLADRQSDGKLRAVPAGGAAYLAAQLGELRRRNPHNITVGVGDLIGASPLTSSLLDDEPAIEMLNRLGLSLSTVGNHEFDHGRAELERKIAGRCPANGCKLAEFRGAKFDYLAANVIDRDSGRPFLPPYRVRAIDGVRVAFIGVTLEGTPDIVDRAGIASLRFENEVRAINALIPEMQAQGAQLAVALVHQGGEYGGPYNDPTYRCEGLQGPIVDIAKALDPFVAVVMSAHTHQGYTCKIDGRLLTQGYSYGALVTEIKLNVDRRSGRVIAAQAENHPVDQTRLLPDASIQSWTAEVEARSANTRHMPVGMAKQAIKRIPLAGHGDSPLGNLVADAQLAYARRFGQADLALMNNGGIRADLPSGDVSNEVVKLSYGDLFATQPFGNAVVVMDLTGEEILELLRSQNIRDSARANFLQVSKTLSYRWASSTVPSERVLDVLIEGKALDPRRTYRVAVNSFLAGGGDGYAMLARGRNVQTLPGYDVDALREYLERFSAPVEYVSEGRIVVGK